MQMVNIESINEHWTAANLNNFWILYFVEVKMPLGTFPVQILSIT